MGIPFSHLVALFEVIQVLFFIWAIDVIIGISQKWARGPPHLGYPHRMLQSEPRRLPPSLSPMHLQA